MVDVSEPDCDPHGVLATCLTLHGVAMGSHDSFLESELIRMETYLQRKLDGWQEYPTIGAVPGAFDNIVKALIVVVLAEWRACP